MTRTLILLFDGTSNEIAADRTNILRLYGCLARTDTQRVWYDPGVGTFGRRGSSRLWSDVKELAGLAFGRGLEDNVLEGYRFLAETWRDGDRIALFGFSRGAYTARVLAGFIHAIGLLDPDQFNMLEYAWRAYVRVPVGSGKGSSLSRSRLESDTELELYRRALRPREPRISFLGLFDTVSSVFEISSLKFSTYPFTAANTDVDILRHALAIDERRRLFAPYRWRGFQGVAGPGQPQLQDAQEVWFAGSHGDVGGGYPEERSALAKVPLLWMLGEARQAGILIDAKVVATIVEGGDPDHPKYVPADPAGWFNDSMSPGWATAEAVPLSGAFRPAWPPAGRSRAIENGDLIHDSVARRMALRPDYRPPNLPEAPVFVATSPYD